MTFYMLVNLLGCKTSARARVRVRAALRFPGLLHRMHTDERSRPNPIPHGMTKRFLCILAVVATPRGPSTSAREEPKGKGIPDFWTAPWDRG